MDEMKQKLINLIMSVENIKVLALIMDLIESIIAEFGL